MKKSAAPAGKDHYDTTSNALATLGEHVNKLEKEVSALKKK